jgi:hypothetical protein
VKSTPAPLVKHHNPGLPLCREALLFRAALRQLARRRCEPMYCNLVPHLDGENGGRWLLKNERVCGLVHVGTDGTRLQVFADTNSSAFAAISTCNDRHQRTRSVHAAKLDLVVVT